MIKMVLKRFLTDKMIISIIKVLNFINQKSYSTMTSFAEILEGENRHPKHRVMQYREWFSSKIDNSLVVLDIGSNNGHMANFLSKSCKFVYGIELSDKMVELANKIYKNDKTEYICADATTYDYSDKKIDCVTMSNVLEHIEHRVDFLIKLINQINWNSNAIFLIRVPMIDRDWMPVYLNELGIDSRLDKTHFIEYTFENFKQEMDLAGLYIEEYHIKWGEIYAVCKTKNL